MIKMMILSKALAAMATLLAFGIVIGLLEGESNIEQWSIYGQLAGTFIAAGVLSGTLASILADSIAYKRDEKVKDRLNSLKSE